MNKLIKRTLENRGLTVADIVRMNDGSHEPLMNSYDLITTLYAIHQRGEEIIVMCDFDMDGISAGCEFYLGLYHLGFKVHLFIPTPSNGYGISVDDIKSVMRNHPNCKNIITCDVGITCNDAIDFAHKFGFHFYVTDHHVGANCHADITVDPNQAGETYEHNQICGAAVVYQILMTYARTYCDISMIQDIRRLQVLAMFGTISDTMPVLYENRTCIKEGLDILNMLITPYSELSSFTDYIQSVEYDDLTFNDDALYNQFFINLRGILYFFMENGIIKDGHVDEMTIGFYMSPMFNAVKRLNGEILYCFNALLGQGTVSYTDCMPYLFRLNNHRKELVSEEIETMLSDDQPYAPYIYLSNAQAGVRGLIATHVLGITGQPCLVVSPDTMEGSGRTPDWYPFISNAAKNCPYLSVAGHEHAFGVKINDLQKAYDWLNVDVTDVFSHVEQVETKPDFIIAEDGSGDTVVDIELFSNYLEELSYLKPFGAVFSGPNIEFRTTNATIEKIGRKKQHVKITTPTGFEIFLWNSNFNPADSVFNLGGEIRINGYLDMSVFNNEKSIIFVGKSVC